MPVSYLSTPYESNPYVVPFDLNLMMKVNEYKQSEFYQNAEKLNTQFQQLNSLDIANPYQKQHAQDVINNLGNQIQQMGGLDYSDPNVSNTISGYTSDVYNDKNIISGIMSTKNMRLYDKNTDAMKNDPKLSKYYDATREWYDKYAPAEINPNSQINYIKGDINSTYNGPTAPAPYLGNDFDILAAQVKKINPNIVESYGPSGNKFFIDMTTKKEVSPFTINRMLDGEIDGKVADQLKVHAAYNYYALTGGKYSKEQGAAEYNKANIDNLNNLNSSIDATQKLIKQEPDNFKRAQLEESLNEYKSLVPSYQKNVDNGNNDFGKIWDMDKNSALYVLYKNKLKNDISSAYSYTQISHKLIVNQEELANARLDAIAARKGLKVKRNADGSISYTRGDESQNPGDGSDTTLPGQLERDFSTEEDLTKKNQVSVQSLTNEISQYQDAQNNSLRDIIFKTAKIANIPSLFNPDESINNDPQANPVSHSDKLKGIAQLTGDAKQLEKSDINRLFQNLGTAGTFDANGKFTFNDKNAKGQEFYNPLTKKPQVFLTADEITFFKNVKDVMDAGANGQSIEGHISNNGDWKQYLYDYSIKQNAIENNKKLIQTATSQVLDGELSKYKLSPQERQSIVDLTQHPSKYGTAQDLIAYDAPMFGTPPGVAYIPSTNHIPPVMASAISKLIAQDGLSGLQLLKNAPDKINNLLNNTANRNNYYNVILPDKSKSLEEQYPGIVHYIMGTDGFKTDGGIIKKVDDIDPQSIVTDGTKYYLKYTSKAKPYGPSGYAEVGLDALQRFGIQPLPYPELEKTVSQNGHLLEPIYIDPNATDNPFNKANNFSGPIKIDIVNMNSTGNRNNDNYTPAIIYKGKNYFYKPGNSKSVNAALEYIKSALQQNNVFKSFDQSTYQLKDGSVLSADDLKAKYNLTDQEIQKYITQGEIIENPSFLSALQKNNNK